jgi:hypothetical protein
MRRSFIARAAYAGRDFLIGTVLVYGYVYTAYKYGNPLLGRNDFFKYKAMVVHPFDFSAMTAPFILRQIPAAVASAFYRLGAHYDTAAVIDSIDVDDETKRQFFAMILSNGLAVCLAFVVVAGYVRWKLSADNVVNSFALFGILAGWFYFPSVVIAPVTVGWGWFASALLVVAFLERNAAITAVAGAIAIFSRETTLIFGLTMFAALFLFEDDRRRGVVVSMVVIGASCLAYLALRMEFTTGYEHQIDPGQIDARLTALKFPHHFFIQLVFSQALLVVLLLGIAMRDVRTAAYLLLSAAVIAIVAIGTAVTDVGILLGETLPFYAVLFVLAWQGDSTAAAGWRASEYQTATCSRINETPSVHNDL